MTDREAFEKIALPNFRDKSGPAVEDHWQTWQEAWQAATLAERERCAKICEAELPADPYAHVSDFDAAQHQMAEYLVRAIKQADGIAAD